MKKIQNSMTVTGLCSILWKWVSCIWSVKMQLQPTLGCFGEKKPSYKSTKSRSFLSSVEVTAEVNNFDTRLQGDWRLLILTTLNSFSFFHTNCVSPKLSYFLHYIFFTLPKTLKGYRANLNPIHPLTQNCSSSSSSVHVHHRHPDESEPLRGLFLWMLWEPSRLSQAFVVLKYRENNSPLWFLLLCGCREYFRIMRWSIPEGRLVNDGEPLVHRQDGQSSTLGLSYH